MSARYYKTEELKKLVEGAGVSSEVNRRIQEAIKKNPHFKGKYPDAIKRALMFKGLLEGIIKDSQGILSTWSDKKKEKFRKDYDDSNISKTELAEKYELRNSNHTYKIAKCLGIDTSKNSSKSDWSDKKKKTYKKDYANQDFSIDKIIEKYNLEDPNEAWKIGKLLNAKRPKSGPDTWPKEKQESFKTDYANADIMTFEILEKYGLKIPDDAYRIARYFNVKRPPNTKTKLKNVVPNTVADKKTREYIEQGILLEDSGFNKLRDKLIKEFPNNSFDKRNFKTKIFELLFVKLKSIDVALQEIVRNVTGMNIESKTKKILEKFKTIYPFIPDELTKKRAKWHKGLVRGRGKILMGKNLPGLGRIDLTSGMPDYEPPRSPYKNPVIVKTENPLNWPIMILNGANLGIKHGPDIVGNVARKAFSDAEERKDKMIILANFLCFDLKKAGGPAKTARAQIMGDNINPELIKDKDYKQVIERIIRDNPMDEVAYRTPEELVNDVLGGWSKVYTKPNYRPEYTGPIYIVIGLNELALIFAVTYWEIRWWTLRKQKELRADIKVLNKALTQAKKELAKDELNKEAYNNVARINEELESLNYQLAITTVSNVANQESQRFFNHAYGVVVGKIEKAIPNSKVIGEGSSYFNIDGKMIEINIPSHLRVTDGLLSDYALSYGPKTLRENIANYAVICHPWALNYQATGRETDHDGVRDSMRVCVAPIAIDDKYLRARISTLRRKDHPIVKAIYTETFRPGIVRLRCSNGIVDADDIPIHALESFKNYPKLKDSNKIMGSAVYNRGPKNIWFLNCSDQHWGGRSKEFVWDKTNHKRLSMAEAVFEMMRREGLFEGNNMPVHFFCSPDDPVQGQNHKYRNEPHPREISYQMIEKVTGDLLHKIQSSKKGNEKNELAEEMRKIVLYQFEKRGADYIFNQMMQMMERHIGANVDAFSAILKRAQSAKIRIQGVGELSYEEYGVHDSRNIGLINIGTGDRHFSKSVDFELIEGPFYALRLRDLLSGRDEWRGQLEFLDKMVVSPIYGQTCIGWGVISVEGKHEYGIEVRSAPTNMSGWGHPLRGHVKKDIQRGNYSRIWNGKLPVLKFFGDKHFFSSESTSYAIYHMSPASVHTDAYGERGFPPNNTGVSFMGVPEDGPNSGPILWRVMPFDVIKDFMEDNPRPFDWVEYLPNPA